MVGPFLSAFFARRSVDPANSALVSGCGQLGVGAQRCRHRALAILGLPWTLGSLHLGATLGEHIVVDEHLQRAGLDVDEDRVAVFDQTDDAARSGLGRDVACLLYTSPSPRDQRGSRMPSSA